MLWRLHATRFDSCCAHEVPTLLDGPGHGHLHNNQIVTAALVGFELEWNVRCLLTHLAMTTVKGVSP